MAGNWTFGRKLALGVAITVVAFAAVAELIEAETRRQVDPIVGRMVELEKKSQQAGAVLDIVAELAEQTNIVAINAQTTRETSLSTSLTRLVQARS